VEALILPLLAQRGPLTGSELRDAVGGDGFVQWKTCMRSDQIDVRRVGSRYLRLDQKVEGYARLSPSVYREFLTYSVVGLRVDQKALDAKARALAAHIRDVSTAKLRLAQRIVADVVARIASATDESEDRFSILLAGDIVHGMGHDAPRPEKSTGQMVRGSDIDLVVLMQDDAPEELAKELDDTIYQIKHRQLINPSAREEIDYIVKPFSRLVEQSRFDTFKSMVSCKIVDESILLHGSRALFDAAKALLVERGAVPRLAELRESAQGRREAAERHLLEGELEAIDDADLYLFHTSEEAEEFY
jgi:hypothetical protein